MLIGLVTKDISVCKWDKQRSSGYRMYSMNAHNGELHYGIHERSNDRKFSTPILNGDIITVIREGTSISFEKNGVSLGKAFKDVPEDLIFFPYVKFSSYGQQFTSV